MIVKVKSNLDHNNVLYKPGMSADLPDDVAESLIKDGVVEQVGEASKPNKPEAPKKPKSKSLSEMNRAELEEVAKKTRVEITEAMKNSDIVAAIKAVKKAK